LNINDIEDLLSITLDWYEYIIHVGFALQSDSGFSDYFYTTGMFKGLVDIFWFHLLWT
jgi:hypothetical protein